MPGNGFAGSGSQWNPNPVPGSGSFESDVRDAIQRLSQNVYDLQAKTSAAAAPAATAQASPYPVHYEIAGDPVAGAQYRAAVFGVAVSFASGWPGSTAAASMKPTSAATFQVQKLTVAGQTVPVGTITILPTGVVQVNAGQMDFAAGDIIALTAPAPADASLASINFTFLGSQSGS